MVAYADNSQISISCPWLVFPDLWFYIFNQVSQINILFPNWNPTPRSHTDLAASVSVSHEMASRFTCHPIPLFLVQTLCSASSVSQTFLIALLLFPFLFLPPQGTAISYLGFSLLHSQPLESFLAHSRCLCRAIPT